MGSSGAGEAGTSERFDGTEHPHAYPKLYELMNALRRRRLSVELRASPLAVIVTRPDGPAEAVRTVTCKPRVTDAERMWFFDDATGEPIAEAEHIIEAAVIIAGDPGKPAVTPYGPMDALYAAVRRRIPQINARCESVPQTSWLEGAKATGNHLHVSYQGEKRRISWDDDAESYVWSTGPDTGGRLSVDVEQAAERIAWALGAPISADPTAEG
ncbi:hypothetical protein [Actinomadura rubrisoli]|uniref:Uncharacterized protein n=1 Tax=Actinomadura rubrisoli TaxID=2530368 RepID=A0A4R5BVR9_9ACTN|nr:hypothetical protein [Actinomadura rubrisoli]TDD88344.1 hypothetical protein E1298_15140 [Actinomadura rubrisoli]